MFRLRFSFARKSSLVRSYRFSHPSFSSIFFGLSSDASWASRAACAAAASSSSRSRALRFSSRPSSSASVSFWYVSVCRRSVDSL